MKHAKQVLFLLIFILFSLTNYGQKNYYEQWPQFRGPFGSGIMDSTDLPESWNVETSENIKWEIDIPGLGHSSPAIWDEKIFITTAISCIHLVNCIYQLAAGFANLVSKESDGKQTKNTHQRRDVSDSRSMAG